MDCSAFGKQLKSLRRGANLTQEQFAIKLNVHEQTVSKWERGVTLPDIVFLGQFATLFNCSVEQVLGIETKHETVIGVFDVSKLCSCIAFYRKKENLSQNDLAQKVGVSSDAISKWERGIACPDILQLVSLAEIFNLSVSRLYFGMRSEIIGADVVVKPKSRAISALKLVLPCVLLVAVITFSVILAVYIKRVDDLNLVNSVDGVDLSESSGEQVEEKRSNQLVLGGVMGRAYGLGHNATLNVYDFHHGIDFIAKVGAEVYAYDDGVIEKIVYNDIAYGSYLIIAHAEGFKSGYYYVDIGDIKVGETVRKGQVIATVAEANGFEYKEGNHLHFELNLRDESVDPELYLEITE